MTAFEKTIQVLKNPWLIISYAILAILVYHFLDRNLALYLHQLEIDTYLRPLKIFTSLGLWFVYVGLFIATGIYFRFIRKHALNEANSW
ncbi:MAG: phosphatidylglycerophosphatase, partial [Legionella sp.]